MAMSTAYFRLASGTFRQDWNDISLITTDGDWANVPSVQGFRGQDVVAAPGANPGAILFDSLLSNDRFVFANLTSPEAPIAGDIAEFHLANPTIALRGSPAADAPHLIIYLDAIGRKDVTLSFNARDIDGSSANAIQQVAVQYRISETGPWINLPPAGQSAGSPQLLDATTGGAAVLVTPVTVTLPDSAHNQAQLQIRIMTSNAVGTDEWLGIDDITVTSSPISPASANASPVNTVPGPQTAEENTETPIPGIVVSDADTSSGFQITVSVQNGSITVPTGGGAAISGNGSASVQLFGTLLQVNSALAGLAYLGDPGFTGPDILTIFSNDSSGGTDTDTVDINVGAANDPPVNSVPGPQAVEEDVALAITGVSVSDADGDSLTTTLSVSNGTLNVNASTGVTGNGTTQVVISGSIDAINAALNTLTYRGNLDFNGTDTLLLQTNDGATSDTDAVTITVGAGNDPPLNSVPGSQECREDTPLAIGGLSVSDIDGGTLTTTLSVTNGTMNVTAGAHVSGNGTHQIVVTGSADAITSTLASLVYQANLDFNGSDALTIATSDGSLTDTDTIAIRVTSVNDAPVLDLDANNSSRANDANYTTTYVEGGAPVAITDIDDLVTDPDAGFLLSATITLLNHQPGDLLHVRALPAGIAASAYDPATGVITLASPPGTSFADFQAALHAIVFSSSSSDPSQIPRVINVVVSDGLTSSNNALVFIDVIGVDNAPTLDLDEDNSSAVGSSYVDVFTQGGPPVSIVDVDVAIADLDDSVLTSATIRLINFEADDLLTVSGALPSGIGASTYDPATGILVLSGTAPLADYQIALRQVEYSSLSASPGTATRRIEVTVNDGALDSIPATTFIQVIDRPPVLDLDADDSTSSGTDYTTTYTENGSPIAIADSDIVITGSANIFAATITLTTRMPGDFLSTSGALPPGIAADYDPITGVMALTGPASIADYQTALRQVVFMNGSDGVTTDERIVEIILNDGADSNIATATIRMETNDDAPSLGLSPSASYTENNPPLIVSPTATLTDVDSASLVVAVVSISSGGFAGDQLSVNGGISGRSGGISFNYRDDVRQLIFTGLGSVAEYETLLRVVQYRSTNDDPTNGGSNPTRTITWTVFDGTTPVTESTLLSINPLNDAPLNAGPTAAAAIEDVSQVVSGLSVSDADDSVLTTTLTVTNGTLNVTENSGVSGNGSASLSISGSIAEINSKLTSLTYVGNPGFFGNDTLVFMTSDGELMDTDGIMITVMSANDAPSIISDGGFDTATLSVTENTSFVTAVQAIDPDGDPLTYAISGGDDASQFQIDPLSGQLYFNIAPNFENPADADRNNVYSVQVSASDGALQDVQDLTITVSDRSENLKVEHMLQVLMQSGNHSYDQFFSDYYALL